MHSLVSHQPPCSFLHIEISPWAHCQCKYLHSPCVCRCCAVHPGYGFLSENAAFAESLEAAGIAFLGPTAATMRMFAQKHTAREYAQKAGVPVLPGMR